VLVGHRRSCSADVGLTVSRRQERRHVPGARRYVRRRHRLPWPSSRAEPGSAVRTGQVGTLRTIDNVLYSLRSSTAHGRDRERRPGRPWRARSRLPPLHRRGAQAHRRDTGLTPARADRSCVHLRCLALATISIRVTTASWMCRPSFRAPSPKMSITIMGAKIITGRSAIISESQIVDSCPFALSKGCIRASHITSTTTECGNRICDKILGRVILRCRE